jgi:transcriptional regulator with XRE-family HTH domain
MNAGLALRRIRSAVNVNLLNFAELVGIPFQTLSAVERGDKKLGDETVKGLFAKLHITEDEFERLCAQNFILNRDADVKPSPVYLAVKYHLTARQQLGFPLDD